MARSFNFADLIEIVCGAVPERKALICGWRHTAMLKSDGTIGKPDYPSALKLATA